MSWSRAAKRRSVRKNILLCHLVGGCLCRCIERRVKAGGESISEQSESVELGKMSALMLDAIGQAVVALDLTGCVTYWNAAAEVCFGWSAAEALGQNAADLIKPDLAEDEALAVFDLLSRGQRWSSQSVVQRRDGTRFPAFLAETGIYSDSGALVGIIGVTTDLSELKKAEQARSDTESQLQAVVANSPVVLLAFDANGTVTFAEGWDLSTFGPLAPSIVGLHLGAIRSAAPAVAAVVARALTGQPSEAIVSVRERTFDFRCRPKHDASGSVVSVLGVASDVTDRVEADRRLREQEARWEALVSQSADVAVIANAATTALTYVSGAASRLFGWQPGALEGRLGLSLVHPDDLEAVTEAIGVVAKSPSAHATVEFRLQCADGSYRWVEEAISNLVDVPGVEGLVGNIRDISQRRAAEQALRERDMLTRALASKASEAALVVGVDGLIRYLNPCASPVLVNAEGDRLDFKALTYVHPDDREAVRATMRRVATPDATDTVTYRGRSIDGGWLWVEQVITNCTTDPDIRGFVVNLREINEQVEAEQALKESEARYRLIAETAQEGIWATDPHGQTLYANQKMADLLGHPILAFYSKPAWELLTGSTSKGFDQRKRQRELHGAHTYDLSHTRPDGSHRILLCAVSPLIDGDQSLGSLAMVSDITEARQAEAALRRRAYHDPLTGLANRALLVDHLQASLSAASPDSGAISVLVADIDQFKLVNDSFGHAAGDELLIEVARRWQQELGPQSLLARPGGDEFVVALNAGVEPARQLAARFLMALTTPVEFDGRLVAISASIGIAIAESAASPDAETLLGYADAAMYDAKAKGRNRIEVFTPLLIERAQRRLHLFNDVKEAIDKDGLLLRYQPVVELATGTMLGVEALCRWVHPERGVVPPDVFIAAAEESALIEALDAWVLLQACRDGASLRAAGVLSETGYVAVNVSARTLARPDFETAVIAALEAASMPAHALVLEVTESAVMSDPDAAQTALTSLRRLGIRVAIDDFGTGYSSLAYLRRFPVSTLKVDRSFVEHICDSPDDRSIVTAIIDLSTALNLGTTAEGIETVADLKLLQGLGCTAGQGFLWSPAISPSQLDALLCSLPQRRFPVPAATPAAAPEVLPPPRRSAGVPVAG